MGRRPAALDVLVSLALAVAMQVEPSLVDTELSDSPAARAGLLAVAAVDAHVAHVLAQLGARDRAQAVLVAHRSRL